MLPQRLTAILLALPLPVLVAVSIPYFITYGKKEKQRTDKQQIGYNKFFLALVGIGYFSIWALWLVGMVLMALNIYDTVFDFLIFSFPMASVVQIVGLVILYVGALFFAWTIGFAGKSLRPSTSGVHADHGLVQDGPLGIVRHPYYVSYVLMLVGLSLALATFWPLLMALCVVIGMGPTAKAEEAHLIALFGEAYRQYQQKVGRFFPKIFR